MLGSEIKTGNFPDISRKKISEEKVGKLAQILPLSHQHPLPHIKVSVLSGAENDAAVIRRCRCQSSRYVRSAFADTAVVYREGKG